MTSGNSPSASAGVVPPFWSIPKLAVLNPARYSVRPMTPEAVRALRGARTRAEFAAIVGVTALTVYRWELPESAPESRRPRGKKLKALERVRDANEVSPPAPPANAAEPAVPTIKSEGHIELDVVDDDSWVADRQLLLPALGVLDEGHIRSAERLVLRHLGRGALRSNAGRALGSAAIIECQLLASGKVDSALAALPALLGGAEGQGYPPSVAIRLYAVAALVFAYGPKEYRDSARVRGLASHAERSAAAATDDRSSQVVSVCARLAVAAADDDPALVRRVYDATAPILEQAHQPLERALAADALAAAQSSLGRLAAARHLEQTAFELAEELGLALITNRITVRRALRARLDAIPPVEALALVEQARASGPAEFEASQLVGAELDALLRGGKLEEALCRVTQLVDGLESATSLQYYGGWLLPAVELLRLKGKREALGRLAAKLPPMGAAPDERARHAYLDATLQLVTDGGRASEAAIAGAEHAQSVGDPQLQLDLRAFALGATVVEKDAEVAAQLRELRRQLGQCPSAWHDAVCRRHEGVLALDARAPQPARGHLEAALATFQLLGDVVQTTQVRGALAAAELAAGDSSALARLRASIHELDELGVATRKAPLQNAIKAPGGRKARAKAGPVARLSACMERLSVRGLSVDLLLRDIERAAQDLLGDAQKASFVGLARGGETATAAPRNARFDISDGFGGRIELGIKGSLEEEERAQLQALCVVSSLALEIAALRAHETAPREPSPSEAVLPELVAASASMTRLRDEILRLRRSKATVLLAGESGTGKEVVARAIHDASVRNGQPYVTFNCASLPRDLFEGQLFGYRKGAFTGASSNHLGVIREADTGTLFLDEIGELPLEVQPKLLRFLENGEVLPLGESKPLRVDVRIVAATHRDLQAMVDSGDFREDLYYRLNVVRFELPPLRERPEDIVVLAQRFIERLTPEDGVRPRVGPEALAKLRGLRLRGNARELRNLLERALAFDPLPSVLLPQHLGLE